MQIKVLGTGCKKCNELEQAIRNAIEALDIDATIEKEEDIMRIMEYGVNRTPEIGRASCRERV